MHNHRKRIYASCLSRTSIVLNLGGLSVLAGNFDRQVAADDSDALAPEKEHIPPAHPMPQRTKVWPAGAKQSSTPAP